MLRSAKYQYNVHSDFERKANMRKSTKTNYLI